MNPRLYIVIPCYNEETVIPIMAPVFLEKLNFLIKSEKLHLTAKSCLSMMEVRIRLGLV